MVRATEAVATGSRQIDRSRRDVGKYLPYLVGGMVHGIPGFGVIRVRIDRNKSAPNAEFISLAAQRHPVCRIGSLQFADGADRHDNAVLIRRAKHIDGVDVGDLLKQFGLRIGPDAFQAGGGDLEVEVVDRSVGVRLAAFDEQRGRLQIPVAEPGHHRARQTK